AYAQLTAAQDQQASRMKAVALQLGAHMSVLQQTTAEFDAAIAEFIQLTVKAKQSKARADLEVKLVNAAASTNQELRRKYRSYDLWRARALLESARRLAVAARRAIEARFVVDLSNLETEQAFVASPSTWADEVYESDLNAPEVVGLSQAPKIEGAIYPNKLLDYVGNLERFVQGYPITYPTSLSLPDTEIISLDGPDQVKTATSTAQRVSSGVMDWRFYCADQKTWISHPGVGEYPVTHRLATACGGKPPALAKIGFWMDAWGSLNGSWTRPVYTERHNVRWRRLAINLVGTGIRDCSKSTDSMNCYTNPFVRFNLVHAGPAWQTNYGGEWRTLDIATASIEGGKALAAEEWLEPVVNSWTMPYVSNVARGELFGRPTAGDYELVLEITPDVRLDRIERIQLLAEQEYWVKQSGGRGLYDVGNLPSGAGGASGTAGAAGAAGRGGGGGAAGSGGSGGAAGRGGGGAAGSSGTTVTGACTPTGAVDLTLDNFEDGNRLIGSNAQRLGAWYGFQAATCSSVPASGALFVPQSPGNASSFSAHAQGSGCNGGSWSGGGIGFNFLSALVGTAETICSNYDASSYTGMAFDAKGTSQVRLEVCTTDHADPNNADCHGAYFGVGTSWTRYEVRWSGLTQRGWGTSVPFNKAHLRKIQFMSLSGDYNFDIDNVSFLNN
ncbi:MAG TPA: hypothetical protein VIV60_35700, partial [Polyangiaceae bacterium]